MNLNWKSVLAGRVNVTVHVGYEAADKGIAAYGSQLASCPMLPVKRIFSP